MWALIWKMSFHYFIFTLEKIFYGIELGRENGFKAVLKFLGY